MLITALTMTAALAGSDPDGVMSTAPATSAPLDATERPPAPPVGGAGQSAAQAVPHGLTADAQIEQWLAARALASEAGEAEAPIWRDDRQVRGEVSVGVGTNGYRDFGAAVSVPIGESGRLDLSVRKTENDPYGYGPYSHGPYAPGLYGYDRYVRGGEFGRAGYGARSSAGPDDRFGRARSPHPPKADPE